MHYLMAALALAFTLSGCSSSPDQPRCTSNADCPEGVCRDGSCAQPPDADTDAETDADTDAEVICEGITCGEDCCMDGARCVAFTCVPDLGPCASNDDCRGDSYCDEEMRCTPYGVPPTVVNDPTCERSIEVGEFSPDEQCRWDGTGAELPTWSAVYSAPMVADFGFDDDPTVLAPSIVFTSYTGSSNGGVLRIIDGRTCETQHTLTDPADRLLYASNNVIVDLDGDGSRPEIVGTSLASSRTAGGIVAFGYNEATSSFERLWYGRNCDAPGEPRVVMNDFLNNNGPSAHDLDDDGQPEILLGRFVFRNDGCAINPSQTYDNYLRLGTFPVVSDIDDDGAPELIEANGVYAWTGSDWSLEPYWAPTDPIASRLGHVAIANVTDAGDARPGEPEIIVSSAPSTSASALTTGTVRVMKMSGEIVFGPYELPAEPGRIAGRGGPPTVGDFDGDGRREFAVAGGSRYTVFDLDCDGTAESAPGCARAAGLPRGVLWSRPSQDFSSNVTGSSVFDFDADGVAEVVYGDECFVRIYRGTDGEVLFSQAASSGTGYEYPVIADVDGDFNSEIVVAMTRGPDCPATDPITPGDVPSASEAGIVVLRDAMDRWAASRPIWNQHAYAVTNIRDNATVPRTSEWTPNHEVAELNNFRMNSQGDLELTGAADLTVRLADDVCGASGETDLSATVCNRGTNPVSDGARVVFYVGDPDDDAPIACETGLPRLLDVAECATVSCTYTLPDGEVPPIVVVVDPDNEVLECREGNNRGVIPEVFCGLV